MARYRVAVVCNDSAGGRGRGDQRARPARTSKLRGLKTARPCEALRGRDQSTATRLRPRGSHRARVVPDGSLSLPWCTTPLQG